MTPGSSGPPLRMWTKSGTLRAAARRNRPRTSARDSCGIGDHLLKGIDDPGLLGPAIAHVDEERDPAGGGEAEQAEDLGARFMRQVGDAESDAEGAFVQAAPDAL